MRLPAVRPATDEMNTIEPALGHHPQAPPRPAGSATGRSPRTRGPTARAWCPACPCPRRCPTLHTSPSRPSIAAAAASTTPAHASASATSAVKTCAVAPSASTSVGGGARGVGVEVGAGRPWRRLAPGDDGDRHGRCPSVRRGRRRAGCPAPTTSTLRARSQLRSCREAAGSRRSRARRRASSASWRRGGTGRRPCTARSAAARPTARPARAHVASPMRLSAWSSSAARSRQRVGVGPARRVGTRRDPGDLVVA